MSVAARLTWAYRAADSLRRLAPQRPLRWLFL